MLAVRRMTVRFINAALAAAILLLVFVCAILLCVAIERTIRIGVEVIGGML